eukprot:g35566.t1
MAPEKTASSSDAATSDATAPPQRDIKAERRKTTAATSIGLGLRSRGTLGDAVLNGAYSMKQWERVTGKDYNSPNTPQRQRPHAC